MRDLLNKHKLVLNIPKEHTHRSHRWQTESTLDYIFSSHHVLIDDIEVLNNTKFPNNLSSHYPVITKLKFQILKKRESGKRQRK